MIRAVADSKDDIGTRITMLEREVVSLRELLTNARADAAAARYLAAGADRELSEARAELRKSRAELRAYAKARNIPLLEDMDVERD